MNGQYLELDQQNGNEQLSSDDEEEANEDVKDIKRPFVGGEGKDGIFKPNHSLVFAILEVLMCILVRQVFTSLLFLILPIRYHKSIWRKQRFVS